MRAAMWRTSSTQRRRTSTKSWKIRASPALTSCRRRGRSDRSPCRGPSRARSRRRALPSVSPFPRMMNYEPTLKNVCVHHPLASRPYHFESEARICEFPSPTLRLIEYPSWHPYMYPGLLSRLSMRGSDLSTGWLVRRPQAKRNAVAGLREPLENRAVSCLHAAVSSSLPFDSCTASAVSVLTG